MSEPRGRGPARPHSSSAPEPAQEVEPIAPPLPTYNPLWAQRASRNPSSHSIQHAELHSFINAIPHVIDARLHSPNRKYPGRPFARVNGVHAELSIPGRAPSGYIPDLPYPGMRDPRPEEVFAAVLAERVFNDPRVFRGRTLRQFIDTELQGRMDWSRNLSPFFQHLRDNSAAAQSGRQVHPLWHEIFRLAQPILESWPNRQEHSPVHPPEPPGGGGHGGGGEEGRGRKRRGPRIKIDARGAQGPVNIAIGRSNKVGTVKARNVQQGVRAKNIQQDVRGQYVEQDVRGIATPRGRAPPRGSETPLQPQVIQPEPVIDADFVVHSPALGAGQDLRRLTDPRRALLPLPPRALPGPQKMFPVQPLALPESTPTHDHGPKQAEAIDPNAPAPLSHAQTPSVVHENNLSTLLGYYALPPQHQTARMRVVQSVWRDESLRERLGLGRELPDEEISSRLYPLLAAYYTQLPFDHEHKDRLANRLLHGLVNHVWTTNASSHADLVGILQRNLQDTNLTEYLRNVSPNARAQVLARTLPVLHSDLPQARPLAHDLARYLVRLGFHGPLPR